MEPAGESDSATTSSGSTASVIDKKPPPFDEEQSTCQQSARETQSTSNNSLDCPNNATNSTATAAASTAATTSSSAAATPQESAFIASLIDDVIFCECLQVHRAAKMGFIFTDPGDETYRIKDGNGLDVFGQPLTTNPKSKKTLLCNCPECGRNIGTVRFAHHLEKCMGMGRLSSRVAAATNKRDALG